MRFKIQILVPTHTFLSAGLSVQYYVVFERNDKSLRVHLKNDYERSSAYNGDCYVIKINIRND